MSDSEVFEVERIIAKRVQKGQVNFYITSIVIFSLLFPWKQIQIISFSFQLQYRVKWLGFPASEICWMWWTHRRVWAVTSMACARCQTRSKWCNRICHWMEEWHWWCSKRAIARSQTEMAVFGFQVLGLQSSVHSSTPNGDLRRWHRPYHWSGECKWPTRTSSWLLWRNRWTLVLLQVAAKPAKVHRRGPIQHRIDSHVYWLPRNSFGLNLFHIIC